MEWISSIDGSHVHLEPPKNVTHKNFENATHSKSRHIYDNGSQKISIQNNVTGLLQQSFDTCEIPWLAGYFTYALLCFKEVSFDRDWNQVLYESFQTWLSIFVFVTSCTKCDYGWDLAFSSCISLAELHGSFFWRTAYLLRMLSRKAIILTFLLHFYGFLSWELRNYCGYCSCFNLKINFPSVFWYSFLVIDFYELQS